MSEQTLTPCHNDIRYEVTIRYFKERSYIIYEMLVHDMGMGKLDRLLFRFSEMSKFNEGLLKPVKLQQGRIPDFPQRNSFVFWNKTNNDHRKIEDRRREL